MPEPTTSPSYLPTYFTYWPTSPLDDMEKGKSAKSPVKEDGGDKKKHKDEHNVQQKVPAREPFVLFQPSISVSRPDTLMLSRPAPVVSIEKTTLPSAAPSEEDLPENLSGNPSLSPSQFPDISIESVGILSSSHSLEPSANNGINLSSSPSEVPTKDLALIYGKPSQAPTFLNETGTSETSEQKHDALNETENTEQGNSTTEKGSGLKVSISGVSLSRTDMDSTDASTKISIAGVLSDTKYDDLDISINKRGKVSFSDSKEETHQPSLAPSESRSSNNISMKDFSRSIDFEDSTLTPSYTPTYLPTSHDNPHSTKSYAKLTLSFPTSRDNDNKGDTSNSSPSSTHDLKPLSYYTELPTTLSTSIEPTSLTPTTLEPSSMEPSSIELGKRNKKTQSPTIYDDTDEPTVFVYPTYYPTSFAKESRMNDASSNPTYLPSYIPTYIPTLETEGRHIFGFGDASGRDNNSYFVINAPENDKFNISLNNDKTSNDLTAANPSITSDQADDYKVDETNDSNGLYKKRICPGFPLGVDPTESKLEQEVFFIYGIEMTKSSDDLSIVESVKELQLHILDDVAMAMLRCDRRGKTSISRVYYKNTMKEGQTHQKNTEISTLSNCANSNSKHKQCAIVESAIYLSVTEGREDYSRVEVLSVVNHRLERGNHEVYTYYLGPDIEQLEGYLELKSSINNASLNAGSSGNPYLFYGAIVTVSIAICTMIGFAMMLEKNRKKRKAAVQYERFSSINSTLNTKNNALNPSSELSDWRSLVGRERF